MKKSIQILTVLALLTIKNQAQTVLDFDGNLYNTVAIGTQVWMKENLKVTHYLNGDIIPNDTSNINWTTLTSGARCYYDNDSAKYDSIYGALYNEYAAEDNRKICPLGWHVPANSEWITLETFLGGSSDAGGKLKESALLHWNTPNAGADNSSNFTALPGGFRYNVDGTFINIGNAGYWWSSTINTTTSTIARYVVTFTTDLFQYIHNNTNGFSIRCIKDSVPVNIYDNHLQNKLQIFPNPASDKVFINYSGKQNVKIQIYNMLGECVLQRTINNPSNEFDISLLQKGIYLFKLTDTEGKIQQELIRVCP